MTSIVHGAPDRLVRNVLTGMTREQRAKALLGLCLRLAECGWRYTGKNGVTWKAALRLRFRREAKRKNYE